MPPSHDYTVSKIRNISDYLRINALRVPDKPWLLYPKRITYRELEREVDRYSYGLSYAGLKPGTRILVMVPASHEFFILAFAILRIGAIPVLIDPGMGLKSMSKALAGLEPEAFVGSARAHLLRLFCPSVFKTTKVSIISGSPRFIGIKSIKYFKEKTDEQYPLYSNDPLKTAAIFFTSGSTGPAKGVVYTAGMLESQIRVTKSLFEIGPDEIDLCTFPLLGLFAICHGNSSVIADMNMVRPAKLDPLKVIRNIQDFGCTQMFGSPMILKRLSDYGATDNIKLPSLRKIISAGAPVHKNILESFSRMLEITAKIHTPYGATEALPVTDIVATELFRIYSDADKTHNESGICIGHPVKGLEVKIIDINDKPLASWKEVKEMKENAVGEIVVRGPWVAAEYLRNPEANALSKIPGNKTNEVWHRMGDLGRIDEDGKIWFYGRKNHRVETADGTLFTIPCEAVYNNHPAVSRSALVGIKTGKPEFKRPVICIQLKTGNNPSDILKQELYKLGEASIITKGISVILFKREFPVDPRHNAKIFREKLAVWAAKKIL